MGAFFPLLTPGPDGDTQPLVLLAWLVAYAISAVGLLDGVLRERQPLRLPRSLVVFVGLTLLSSLWSIAPAVTLRRSVALLGTVTVGLFLARRLAPLDALRAVRQAALVVAVASLLLYAIGDPRAVDDLHQSLQGVLATKNSLGRVMAIGILATALEAHLDRRRWRPTALSAFPMLCALGLTESASGILVTVVGLAVITLLALMSSQRGVTAIAAAASLAVAVVAAFALTGGFSTGGLTGVAGRDATLTGRTGIWQEVVASVEQRPVLGHGYGAFWDAYVSGGHASEDIRRRLDDTVANAHNGWLETALSLGLVGALAAAALLASCVGLAWSDARTGRRASSQFRCFAVLLVLAATAAESGLLQENTVLTVLLAYALGVGTSTGAPLPSWRAVRQQPGRLPLQ